MLLKTENYDIEGHKVTINQLPPNLAIAFMRTYLSKGIMELSDEDIDKLFNIYFNRYVQIDGVPVRLDLLDFDLTMEIYDKFTQLNFGNYIKKLMKPQNLTGEIT